ncbi:hypothetical protein G5V57_03175 [Nordella sp. HKS 07]|uniref:hypothetical protein n=1 Tax=Nordella sp. HKS 07 TaxID=2712222 RepID=UPI0013E12217|nr:hypothetical protein [Nordella sp. HKS 07]QIG46834.1 hypothetical protein G5V57_03175 [Nordella sp. HKS 07]
MFQPYCDSVPSLTSESWSSSKYDAPPAMNGMKSPADQPSRARDMSVHAGVDIQIAAIRAEIIDEIAAIGINPAEVTLDSEYDAVTLEIGAQKTWAISPSW